MKKLKLIFLLVIELLIVWSVTAQNDSLSLVSAKWETEEIAEGIVWKHFLFKGNLFNSNQSINILEIRKNKRKTFSIGYEPKELKLTSQFGKESNALAALNGTFFDTRAGGSVDLIRANGKIINSNQTKDGKRAPHQKSSVAISKGRLKIEKWNGDMNWEEGLKADELMVSGPLLVYNNKSESLDSLAFNITRHPRTAVAVTTSGKILLITVDGRNENAAGMSLFELRNILKWFDSEDAINLDGGGSSTLWISGQPDGGVVNYPCDNKKWDHEGERKVANVILVRKKN